MVTIDHIVLVVLVMVSGIIGIVFNCVVALMGAIRSDLKQDYIWFIIVTATSNVVYCFGAAILQAIVILGDFEEKGTFCQFTGFIAVMAGTISLLTQPFLALNRYSAIFNRENHSKRFSKRNILFMVLFICFLSFIGSIGYWLLDDYGRIDNTICGMDMDIMPIWHFIVVTIIPTSVSYSISIICGVKISRFLKKHENDARRHEMRTMIRESKQIVKLIFIELLVPLCLECPALMLIVIAKFTTVSPIIFVLAIGCFVAHNPIDPVIIIMVVKPYRSAMKKMINKLRNNNVAGTDVTPHVEPSGTKNFNF